MSRRLAQAIPRDEVLAGGRSKYGYANARKENDIMRNFPFSLLPVLLLWSVHTPAQDAGEIRFKPGTVTGVVNGEATTAIRTHTFRAQKDQRITVTLARGY